MVRKVNTYSWALASIFGAIQLVVVVLPFKIAIGGTGGFFLPSLISASVIGYLLGPRYGTAAVFIGTLIGGIVHPLFAEPTFGGLRYFIAIAPASGALVAGLIKTKRSARVPVVYLVAILAMASFSVIVTPLIFTTFIFLWFHLVAFSIAMLFLIPRFRNKYVNELDLFTEMNRISGVIVIWLLVFISVMVSHLVDLVLKFYYFAIPAIIATPEYPSLIIEFLNSYFSSYYNTIIFVYPIETILAAIVGCVVIYLITIVQTRFPSTPPSPVEIEE
jgi:hypothetical protein